MFSERSEIVYICMYSKCQCCFSFPDIILKSDASKLDIMIGRVMNPNSYFNRFTYNLIISFFQVFFTLGKSLNILIGDDSES